MDFDCSDKKLKFKTNNFLNDLYMFYFSINQNVCAAPLDLRLVSVITMANAVVKMVLRDHTAKNVPPAMLEKTVTNVSLATLATPFAQTEKVSFTIKFNFTISFTSLI